MDDHDAKELRQFGYQPQLRRSLGHFSSIALPFSIFSVFTGVFASFAHGPPADERRAGLVLARPPGCYALQEFGREEISRPSLIIRFFHWGCENLLCFQALPHLFASEYGADRRPQLLGRVKTSNNRQVGPGLEEAARCKPRMPLKQILPALFFQLMNGAGTLAQHFCQLFVASLADSS